MHISEQPQTRSNYSITLWRLIITFGSLVYALHRHRILAISFVIQLVKSICIYLFFGILVIGGNFKNF